MNSYTGSRNGLPVVIQGGMGAGVSNWRLARAVSRLGQLGVVSGTALDQILVRRLQDGDVGGHMRRGFDAFPYPALSEPLWERYFLRGGRAAKAAYRVAPRHRKDNSREATELCIVGNFVEVYLAREGHGNPVGINYLEKIQAPLLASIYGAMLADVGYIVMGAGIPLKVPAILDGFVEHRAAEYSLHVSGALAGDDHTLRFDPREFMDGDYSDGRHTRPLSGPCIGLITPVVSRQLNRPLFLPIVSSNTLATTMLRKANGRVDGLIVELPNAGGHNAPPRGKLQLTESGEPIYGERDAVDIEKLRELKVPFWLAGGYGRADKLAEALALGATGVQVGTAFEFTSESGLAEGFKESILAKIAAGEARVFTDPLASPTGFPFKVVVLEGTSSEAGTYAARPRVCDLGFLQQAYRMGDGEVGYRCASEPVGVYKSKGGFAEDTVGRKCLCNALLANIGLAQIRNGGRVESGLVTAGDDLDSVAGFVRRGGGTYTAADVVEEILRGAGGLEFGFGGFEYQASADECSFAALG